MITDSMLRSLKPNGKVQTISDGEGLFIMVTAKGSKLWRLAYRFDGKQRTLCIGSIRW